MQCGDPEGAVIFAGVAGGAALVGAALAGPVVGARGLILSMERVSPAELADREAALTRALSQMAAQDSFHDALLETGTERIRGRMFWTQPENGTETNTADAILEATVDDLRLERAGTSEGSYFLRIKTHARLVRVADGGVCFEQRAEYRSDQALFLDWTLQGAIQGVAQTGYRALAQYYISQLAAGSGEPRKRK
jgi:hypothetical protein